MKWPSALLGSLIAGLAASGSALTVTGAVDGAVLGDTRLGGFVVTPFGQPVQEVVSVPVTAGARFRLEVPAGAPIARAQVALTPQNVSWPGVLDPVSVSTRAQAAELKFFTYRDANANGRRDDAEAVREVTPNAGSATLFIAWVNTDVTVSAARGFEASLKRGWNAFLVDVGKAVKVQDFQDSTVVTVRMGR